MSGADSRTGFWLVENLAWAGLSYKLKLRAIYVWTFELHTVEQACHFHALDFEFVSKQTLITEIVPCYKEDLIELLAIMKFHNITKEMVGLWWLGNLSCS